VTHLPEHTAMPKKESLALLFEIAGFEENVSNFPFFSNAMCSDKDTSDSVFLQTTQNNGVL
jgi:hypothetical protein